MTTNLPKPAQKILEDIELLKNQDFDKVILTLQESTYIKDELVKFLQKMSDVLTDERIATLDNQDIEELIHSFQFSEVNLSILEFLADKLK